MNDAQRRKNDKLDREDVFIIDNAGDFPAGSDVAGLTDQINVERGKILQFDADQLTGFSGKSSAQGMYEDRRDKLVDLLDKFQLGGEIVEDDIEGTAAKFRNKYPRTDQILIARATSFHAESEPIKEEMAAAGVTSADRAALLTLRDEFQQAAAEHDSSEERHAEATGGMNASFRTAMALSARRAKRVKMKYRDNPAKLAAWTVASHLDRAPKKAAPPTPQPPSP